MKESTRVLVALAAAVALGALIAASHNTSLLAAADVLAPIGTLWVNAIRMTVIPLVVSLLVTGVCASGEARAVRALGLRAVAVFFGLMVFAALVALVLVPPLFAWLHVDPAAAAALRGVDRVEVPPAAV